MNDDHDNRLDDREIFRRFHPDGGNDVIVWQDAGTLAMVRAVSDAGHAWMQEHVPADDDHTYFGDCLAVEWRYLDNLVDGMRGDGLVVR